MESHFTYLNYLTEDQNIQKVLTGTFVALGLILIAGKLKKELSTKEKVSAKIIPDQKISLFSFFDLVIETFVKFHDSVVGVENRHHIFLTGSIFIFIATTNLLSLVPGVPAATTTVWVNVAMAIVVFIYFNWQGMKAHGVIGYMKHFCGPLWILAPLIFPIEIFSTCLRILTLNLRLYWNISGDHMVLGIFTHLLWPGLAAPIYILGTFVSLMQAFIFTVLTMVYIKLASDHGEEEGHH